MTGLRPRSLPEYLGLLRRKKFSILLATMVVLAAFWLVIKRLPDIYESRSLVVVADLRGDESRQAIATEISLITRQLESRTILQDLAKRYDLYPGLSSEARAGRMSGALKLETKMRGYYPETPEAVAISFRYSDPAKAQRVLNDVVTFFANTNALTARLATEEAKVIESKIAEVEAQLQQQSSRRGAPRVGLDPRALRAERMAATATVESLKDKQYALERRIAEQRGEITEQQKLVKATPPVKPGGAQGALLVRKAELEGLLKDYAAQYTDKNPKVTQTRHQLSEVNRQLAQLDSATDKETASAGTAESRELRALQRDLARMETDLEVTQRELNRRSASLTALPTGPAAPLLTMEGGGSGGASGMSEATYLQNRYVSLLDRRDRLQMALSTPTERGLEPFRIVDAPNLPLSPTGPDRTKLKLIALAVALAVGLGAAVLVEGPRLRLIRDEGDAEYFLGAPVVGLIPESLTPDERGHQRRLRLTRKLMLLGAAAMAVPLLAMLIYKLEIIQRIAFR